MYPCVAYDQYGGEIESRCYSSEGCRYSPWRRQREKKKEGEMKLVLSQMWDAYAARKDRAQSSQAATKPRSGGDVMPRPALVDRRCATYETGAYEEATYERRAAGEIFH